MASVSGSRSGVLSLSVIVVVLLFEARDRVGVRVPEMAGSRTAPALVTEVVLMQ